MPSPRHIFAKKSAFVFSSLLIATMLYGCDPGPGESNSPPVASIAAIPASQPIASSISLDGSASSDPDGNTLSYQWTIISAPTGSSATLQNATAAQAQLIPDIDGDYSVSLQVSDNSLIDTDSVSFSLTNNVPTANAGADQSVDLGSTVNLDGTTSTDLDGQQLSFSWSIDSTPTGSAATLSSADSATPSFIADSAGDYVLSLTVNDGFVSSAADTVTVSTINSAPVANAGPDQGGVVADDVVTLNGGGSSDTDGDALTYQWAFTSVPTDSVATLNDAAAVAPQFTVDKKGEFILQLIVNDGQVDSAADLVTITAGNTPPVGNAGADAAISIDSVVNLSGANSTDADGDALTYTWSFTSRPAGSAATITNASQLSASFTADVEGDFVVQLMVDDGEATATDTATFTAQNLAPVAVPGDNQAAVVGATVLLDGSASYDPENAALTYSWSFTSIPNGSAATLSDATTSTPSFVVDVAGTYVVQLIVNDGEKDSVPVTVTISDNPPPLADAGADITVFLGETISLDGSASSDANSDPLTYSWSVLNQPQNSTATFNTDAIAEPELTVNTAGVYQVQLSVSDGVQTDLDTVMVTVNDGDQDNDGILSSDELRIGLNPNVADSDGNGIADGDEDHDNDNLINRWETVMGYDINDSDSDNNGTLDGDEDFDGDGISNAVEIANGTDPMDPNDPPAGPAYPVQFDIRQSPVVVGDHIEYVITVGNRTENSVLNNLQIQLTVPADVSFHRLNDVAGMDSTSSTGCTSNVLCDAGDVVVWNIGNLAANESLSIVIEADVAATVTPGTVINTEVVFSADQFAAQTLQRSVNTIAQRDIDFTLGASVDPIIPGDSFSYQLNIGNASNGALPNGSVQLNVPVGLTVTDISNGGTQSGNVVTWSVGGEIPAASIIRTVEVTANANLIASSILTATADLSFPSNSSLNQVREHSITVGNTGTLNIEYQLLSAPVVVGDLLQYAITLSNTSNTALLSNLILQMRVPDNVNFQRVNDVALLNSTSSNGCVSNVLCDGGDEVFWSISQLQAGESVTVHIDATVDAALTPGSLIETPIFISADGVNDLVYQTRTTAVVSAQPIYFEMSASTDAVVAGDTVIYEIDLGNASNNAINNALITTEIPSGMGSVVVNNGGSLSGNTITWTVSALNPTASVKRSFSMVVPASNEGDDITVNASLAHNGGLEIDRQLTQTITVAKPRTFEVNYAMLSEPVVPGGHLTYSISLSNTSAVGLIQNAVLQLNVPTGISFQRLNDVSFINSDASTGCVSNVICDAGDEVFWNVTELAAGESITLNIEADVDANVTPGTIISAPIFVSADGLEDVITLQKNVPVVVDDDIQFAITASKDPVAAGEIFEYRVDIGNSGNAALTNADISLQIPEGVSAISASDGGVVNGNVVTWSLATLAPAQSTLRTIEVQVSGSALTGSVLSAVAQLSYDGGIELDREVTVPVSIKPNVPLNIAFNYRSAPTVPGGKANYEITISNNQVIANVDNVTLQLRVPEGVSFQRVQDVAITDSTSSTGCVSNVNCAAGDEVVWSLGQLSAGQSITLNIDADIDAGIIPGTLITTPLFVSADGIEDSIEMHRTLPVAIDSELDMLLTASADAVATGDTIQYELVLGNSGNSAINNSDVQMVLPAGVSVASISDGGMEIGDAIVWSSFNLSPGATTTRSVSVTVDSGVNDGQILVAKAMVMHSNGVDIDRELSVNTTVQESMPITVSYTVESSENPGDVITLNLSIQNTTAVVQVTGLTVHYRVPVGVDFHDQNDVSPPSSSSTGCTSNVLCNGGDEVIWNLPTLTAGATSTVSIDMTLDAAAEIGSLLEHSLFVIADGLEDQISLQRTTRVVSP